MPAAQLAQLCEPLYRSDKARARQHGGSGLGLAICEAIAQAHGGHLDVSASALGGLRISVSLPQRAQATNLAAPVAPSASHVAFGSIRVEPVFLALGTAAGAAVRVAQQTGAAALADVDVGALQAALKEVDQCFHWDAAKGACADTCP